MTSRHPDLSPAAGRFRHTTLNAVRGLRRFLPARTDWVPASIGSDLLAGLMVALVALPLALGFGASAGMGASSGLITAVVAGAVAAVFGGSRVQVSGPTGAMTVVLIPIIAEHGADGVLVVGMLAGVMLLALGFAGIGRVIRYLPVTVVEGFTAGIAIIIALQQVPAALGMSAGHDSVLSTTAQAIRAWFASPQLLAPVVTIGAVALILVLARVVRTLPGALFAVVAVTVANSVFGWGLATIGAIPSHLPAPSLPSIAPGALVSLMLPALAVAALAALESLLSATAADAMTVGSRHDPDRELVGQGLANLAAPLFGGVPATAAIARTAVNVRSGARTRLASLTHAAVLLFIVLVASGLVAEIPMVALAGVLIATAVQMVKVSSLRALARSTRGDAAALILTAVATVVFDLVTAVLIGLVVAGFFAIRQTARTARLDEIPLDETDHAAEEQRLLDDHIVAFRIDGPLFFGAAHDFLLELTRVSHVQVVVLRLSRVTTLDATGAHVLADIIERLEHDGITVMLSGARPEHERVLREMGVHERLAHERHLFATTPEAIAHAREHVARVSRGTTPVAASLA